MTHADNIGYGFHIIACEELCMNIIFKLRAICACDTRTLNFGPVYVQISTYSFYSHTTEVPDLYNACIHTWMVLATPSMRSSISHVTLGQSTSVVIKLNY